MQAGLAAVCALSGLWFAAPARAQDAADVAAGPTTPSSSPGGGLLPSYLWDGGALIFVWGALAASVAVDRWVSPPDAPVGFSASEGGGPVASWEVPDWVVPAGGGALAAAMLASGDPARWDHVKGLAQTLATGQLLTISLKVGFGRRRPDQAEDPDAGFGGGSRSFPSGHAGGAASLATYAALYLHRRVWAAAPPRWWHGAVYAGLGGVAALAGAERVWHRRHHVTDVLAGAALGTATATAFFFYQEQRARAEAARPRRSFLLAPALSAQELGLRARWQF